MMIIELKEAVQVRVPEESLPYVTKNSVFHTFPAGSKVNYYSKKSGDAHMVHGFSGYVPKFGLLRFMCVTELRENPSWL